MGENTIDLKTIIICPGCGWAGNKDQLLQYGECPSCGYENFDGSLLSIDETIKNRMTYNNVRLDLFLQSLLKIVGTNVR